MADVELTAPQAEFIFSKATNPAMIAGYGSGKSEAATRRLVNLMIQDAGISVSHFFPSYRLAKRRGFDGVKKYLDLLGFDYKVNRSDLSVRVPEVGGIFYLETYHDPDAIVSFEVAHSVIDELDTLPKDKAREVWTKISERTRQRCRHVAGNTVGAATTPDQGTSGFCFETWGNGQHLDEGYHYIRAGTRSNSFLPDGYADQIAKNYDPIMAEAYLDGGWVSFTRNKVYHFFDKIRHASERLIRDGDALHIGLDFNIGGTCANVWVIDDNIPIAVDEFISHDTRDFINGLSRYKGHKIKIYPDASGRAGRTNASESDIAMIIQAGFSVDVPKTNPPVRDRINSVNALFSHDLIKINTKKCQELTDAFASQGYDSKGEPEKFNTHPAIDDHVDSAGYFLHRKFPIIRPVFFTGIRAAY